MYFTQDDYKKIQRYLTDNAIKDTWLPQTNTVKDGDKYTIIQDNENKIIEHSDFIQCISEKATDKVTETIGQPNGIAPLNDALKIPNIHLPSYVDDVLEYPSKSKFPRVGESGKIYLDTTSNYSYRWSGSAYVLIGNGLELGKESGKAFPGDAGAELENKVSALESKPEKVGDLSISIGSFQEVVFELGSGVFSSIGQHTIIDNNVEIGADVMVADSLKFDVDTEGALIIQTSLSEIVIGTAVSIGGSSYIGIQSKLGNQVQLTLDESNTNLILILPDGTQKKVLLEDV